jgi:hypothetical protein
VRSLNSAVRRHGHVVHTVLRSTNVLSALLGRDLRRYRFIVWSLIPILAAACASTREPDAAFGGCIRSDLPTGESSRQVSLLTNIPRRVFFYPSFDSQYDVAVSQGALRSRLDKKSRLSYLLKNQEPLESRVDLRIFESDELYDLYEVQIIAASLLEYGQAALVNRKTGALAPSVSLGHWNNERHRTRTFRIGESIVFFQSDCTVD